MQSAWINRKIQFDENQRITCSSYECDVSNYTPPNVGFFSKALNWVSYLAQKPGSYFFDFLMKRNNPYPGTFDALNTHTLYLFFAKLKNWVLGSAGMIAFALPYLAGSAIRLAVLSYQQQGMLLIIKPKEGNPNQPLTLLSRNTALLPDALNGRLNMRENAQRVPELANSFIKPLDEKDTPTILCLQEVFDIKATETLAERLAKEYPYLVHKVAPSAMTFSSGLVIASKLPIEHVRYIQFPVNIFLAHKNLVGRRFNSDAFCNKGMLIALVQHQDESIIVVNAHCQPTTSVDSQEIAHCKQIRALQLKIITQATFDYVSELEERGIKPTKVLMSGDLNCTDTFGPDIELNDRKENPTFFKGIFPGEAIDTWMKHYDPSKQHEHDEWDIKQKDEDPTSTLEGVQLDHVGLCYLKESKDKTQSKAFFDQGYSKKQPTAASDHAGILMKVRGKSDEVFSELKKGSQNK